MKASSEIIENGRGTDSIQLDAVRSEIEALNKIGPPDENAAYEKAMENQKANLDSGWITQEEYEEALEIYQQYATYVATRPSIPAVNDHKQKAPRRVLFSWAGAFSRLFPGPGAAGG